jgi:hypothetical protein
MADDALTTARIHLQTWLDAELKVAQGQTVMLNGNRLDRAALDQILGQIKYWRAEVERLTRAATTGRTGIGTQRIVLHG